MTKYVVELLDVEPIAEKLRNWRAPDNKNILHFACMTVNKEIIECVSKLISSRLDLVFNFSF